MNIIELRNINKIYGSGNNQVHVLKNVNLDIESGDFVAIIGQSGSGKSTLMNILGCLDTASSGDYKIAGEDLAGMSPDDLATLRSKYLGFIFQRYNLLATLNAEENVELPAIYSGLKSQERKEPLQSGTGQPYRPFSFRTVRRPATTRQYCPCPDEWRRNHSGR